MKFSFTQILLLAGSFAVFTAAMPAYYADEDVEVRSPPELQNEVRQIQAVAEIGKMIFDVVGGIKAGIAADKNVRIFKLPSLFYDDLLTTSNRNGASSHKT